MQAGYPLPAKQESVRTQPKHKFTIQYEGEGVIDSNVVALFKALSGEDAGAGAVAEIAKALQGQGATATPDAAQSEAPPATTGEGIPGGKKDGGPTSLNLAFPFLQSLPNGRTSGAAPPFLATPPPPPPITVQTAVSHDPVVQLKRNGVTWIKVDILPSGIKLTCRVPDKENAKLDHLYQVVAPDYGSGVRAVLSNMERDKAKTTLPSSTPTDSPSSSAR
jgi:hypothetical protein